MRLYSAEAMRATDARALELGYPSLLLMEAAGRAVAEEAHRQYPRARCAAVLVGPGNNGGDGMVAARWLLSMGLSVRVFAADGHRWDAALAKAALTAHGVKLEALSGLELASCELVIDALFGTGLKRSLAGVYAEVVNKINASALPVVSVDLPSGLPHAPHVRADCTVSLGGLKYEHLFYPYREACGRVRLAEIGLPAGALESAGLPVLSTPRGMRGLLPRRAGNAHKGSVGRVLVVGGFGTYTGAPVLAALGAYRSGAGLVYLAYPENVVVAAPLEVVRRPFREITTAVLREVDAEAVAVGMGAGPRGREAASAVLGLGRPTVLDADALYPEVLEAYAERGLPVVITPHPKEASRLLPLDTAAIAEDPLAAAGMLAEHYNVTVVLKGGPSVVASAGGVAVNTTGNPAMAAGGMGDVLSGVIAAFLAVGLPPFEAAELGVYLHGLAGDRLGEVGLLAHEVANALPGARAALSNGEVEPYWV